MHSPLTSDLASISIRVSVRVWVCGASCLLFLPSWLGGWVHRSVSLFASESPCCLGIFSFFEILPLNNLSRPELELLELATAG